MTLLRWLTFLLRSQTVILTVLLFWTFSFFWSNYLFYNGFSSIGKFWPCCCLSFHWLSIKFTIGCPHFIALLMTILVLIGTIFVIMWDVPWKDIFKLSASAATTEFCEWVQVGIDLYIPHRKYQVKLHLSPWFSAACDATIVHRNHFFHLYQKDKSSDSKVKFRQASNRCKRVLEAAKLAYATKTKESLTSHKLGSRYFWYICNSALTKVNLLFPSITNLNLHNSQDG